MIEVVLFDLDTSNCIVHPTHQGPELSDVLLGQLINPEVVVDIILAYSKLTRIMALIQCRNILLLVLSIGFCLFDEHLS